MKIGREILSSEFPPLWLATLAVIKIRFPIGNTKAQLPGGEISPLPGESWKDLNKEIQWYFHQKCYLIAISIKKYYWLLPSSHLHLAHSEDFYLYSVWRTTLVIEFPVCGGEIGPLSMWHAACLQIWTTDIVLVPFSNHAAEALRVLCCLNILVSTPVAAMMFVIHRARVCVDWDLCGFLSCMNILMASMTQWSCSN